MLNIEIGDSYNNRVNPDNPSYWELFDTGITPPFIGIIVRERTKYSPAYWYKTKLYSLAIADTFQSAVWAVQHHASLFF